MRYKLYKATEDDLVFYINTYAHYLNKHKPLLHSIGINYNDDCSYYPTGNSDDIYNDFDFDNIITGDIELD